MLQDIKARFLTEILALVPFDGWNQQTLEQAAVKLGYSPGYAEIVFPGGTVEAIDFFIKETDRSMELNASSLPLADMRVRDRIAAIIRLRLEHSTRYKLSIRKAITHLALPQHAAAQAKAAWNTADSIWRLAGDNSTDFNYYSKRFLLASVYSATLLFWLEDTSDNHQESWAFLDRRIQQVMKIGSLKGASAKCKKTLHNRLKHIPFLRMI